jgi:hypothetical protein
MAAVIWFTPLTDHGRELLDELERQTEHSPTQVREDGSRCYYLSAAAAGVEGFDAKLDSLDSNWAEHLSRTEQPQDDS